MRWKLTDMSRFLARSHSYSTRQTKATKGHKGTEAATAKETWTTDPSAIAARLMSLQPLKPAASPVSTCGCPTGYKAIFS